MEVGRSLTRVDAFDKVTGRAKYTDDLHGEAILVARILHSTIANGVVRSMDISEAQAVPGVVKVLTCLMCPTSSIPRRAIPGVWRRRTRTWPTESCWPPGYASMGTTSP